MGPGETTAPPDDGDDLAARLADPVLVAARDEPPAPPDPPAVWGALGPAVAGAGGDGDGDVVRPDEEALEARARELVDRMTLHEKVELLSGDRRVARGLAGMARRDDTAPYVAGALPRLGIPGIRCFGGGPHGVGSRAATAFPVAMARGATFDPDLEERVGDAIGAECRALGANLFAGVCVDLLRHPASDRAQQTFGEDPHHLGEMGAALVRGAQRHVMACVTHLACDPMDDARRVDVSVDEDDLRDVYLPHVRRCVDAGAAAVMTARNQVNGEWCGHHHHLVTEVLKGEWGFDGFVMSDLVLGVRSGLAVAAGQDLEMPFRWRFRSLARLVRQGRVTPERVDDAARRLVRQQVRFADRTARPDRPGRYAPAAVAGAEHRALARAVAERSMVLLRNEAVPGPERAAPAAAADHRAPVLPLDPDRVRSLAVLGGLAAVPLPGGHRSGAAPAPGISPLGGLRAAGERYLVEVVHQPGDDLDAAGLAAGGADAAVVVVGDDHRGGGPRRRRRGGDRRSLTLRAEDEALIRTAAAANPRTVVVLVVGSAVVTESWREQVGAVLVAWYPGVEGGTALARVLFGEAEPGGRLPSTWPRGAEQLPPFEPDAGHVRYGPRHGYRLMEATGRSPAFPFGFGLAYTTFEHGRLEATRSWQGPVRLTVPVVNTGVRPGDEVVQVYLDEAWGSDRRPLRTLRAFRRVTVAPGTATDVTFDLGPDLLARAPRTPGGKVRIHVGRDADPAGHRTVEA